MIYYKCQHFKIEELVDRRTFEQWGEKAWMFFQPKALMSLDNIRVYFGKPVTVNNWCFGGMSENRGLRPPYSVIGADYSQHRYGNAFDIDIENVNAEDARQTIIKLKDSSLFYHITALEIEIPYIHFDCRNIMNRILLIPRPK